MTRLRSSTSTCSVPDDDADAPDTAAESPPAQDAGTGDALARLAETIGVRFHDLDVLRLAVTHRSVLHEWAAAGLRGRIMQSNERLEFLGDAYLGTVVAEYLYDRYPNDDEGTLTARRVALVRTETLVRWARSIDLGSYLYLGQGERLTESPRDRILAGAFEALVGAVAVDRGWRETRRFVLRFLRSEPESPAASRMESEANPKGRLQEFAQGTLGSSPTYELLAIEGPDHDRRFTVAVSIDGERWGTGSGGSKREAQQAAAWEAVSRMSDAKAPAIRTRPRRSRRSVSWAGVEGEAGE
ncbi:MAG TPA: ribonuclease III [Thermomicrobiales bacterium]|nr:ribonuclease III [Thermomicrobiales bacterium]